MSLPGVFGPPRHPDSPPPPPKPRKVAAIVKPVGTRGTLHCDSNQAYTATAVEAPPYPDGSPGFNLIFELPSTESGGATLDLDCAGFGPWSGRVTLNPVLGTDFSLWPAAPPPPVYQPPAGGFSRAQVRLIQCDMLLWCPELRPQPNAQGLDERLQINLKGDGRVAPYANGIAQGWIWTPDAWRYPPAERQIMYREARDTFHWTHFPLHVSQMGPNPGYHGVFPFSQAHSDAYGEMMNTMHKELTQAGLIPLCAGVAPGGPPANGFDRNQVRAAMTDWDNTAEAASRIRAISEAFPNAELFFELPASNIWPDPSADDPVAPNQGSSNPWIRGMLQRYPRFAGVIHEADIDQTEDQIVALYTAKHGWWHDLDENQGELRAFRTFWSGGDVNEIRRWADAIAARCPWLKGTMNGWSMRPAPPPETAPESTPQEGDSLDARSIIIEGGPADLLQWPATAKITSLQLTRNGIQVEFTKHLGPAWRLATGPQPGNTSWPDMAFGQTGADNLQYCMGLCLQAASGQWYAAAPIQMWRERLLGGGSISDQTITGGPAGQAPGQIPQFWFYDGRWPVLHTLTPRPGDKIGFFVAAGDIRGGGFTVRERSNIVTFALPPDKTEQGFLF